MKRMNPVRLREQRFCNRVANGWLVPVGIVLLFAASMAQAANLKLQGVDFTSLSGNGLQVQLSLNATPTTPRIFHTDNPARIALDLPGVANALDKKNIPVNSGGVESIQAVEASGRTRVILNLTSVLPYSSRVEGNSIYLTLRPGQVGPYLGNSAQLARAADTDETEATPVRAARSSGADSGAKRVENVDFRRGEKGEGRLLITLSDPRTVADIREQGRKVIVSLPGVSLPRNLARRLDVIDFATPVQTIDATEESGQAKLFINPISDEYDYSSYQTGKVLTVEVRPLTKAEKEEIKRKAFSFTGEKLSLNFQDIPVRSVLQILADFTDLNIVASDTVQGNVTLRLEEVPWDQALDLVLKSKGLGKRQEGNIVRVAPIDEINRLEKEELEAQKTVEELEPLRTEIIQINYTKAEDIKKVLAGTTEQTVSVDTSSSGIGSATSRTTSSSTSGSGPDISQSILSGRGNVTVDERTNQLIVKDTARNLERIRELIMRLDIPVRQVLIESRIVIANNDFTRELGSRLAVNRNPRNLRITNAAGEDATVPTSSGRYHTNADMLVDLAKSGAAGPGGAIGATVLKVGDYLLDLELSAAQRDGRGEVVSNPRLITTDQTKAVIKQGIEIPFQATQAATVGTGGFAVQSVSFKQAVLELNVTPHITPDDMIVMELLIKKDSKGEAIGANFAIEKREIETTAEVENGETVVLGGVYEGTKTNNTDKVPFFGDLPGIGFMFRRNLVEDKKKELLIFITPKILKQQLVTR